MRNLLALALLSSALPAAAYDPDHVLEEKVRSGDNDARYELERRVEGRRAAVQERLNPDSSQIDDLRRDLDKMYDYDSRRGLMEKTLNEGLRKVQEAASRDRAARAEYENYDPRARVTEQAAEAPAPSIPNCGAQPSVPVISTVGADDNVCAYLAYEAAFDALPPARKDRLAGLPIASAWLIRKNGKAFFITYQGAATCGSEPQPRPCLRFSDGSTEPEPGTKHSFQLAEIDGGLYGIPLPSGEELNPFEAKQDGNRIILRFFVENVELRKNFAVMVLEPDAAP